MRSVLIVSVSLLFASLFNPTTAYTCGVDEDCLIGERTYRIRMPDPATNPAKKPGAIIYLHGYSGSAAGVMRNKNMGKAVADMGLALVAPKSAYRGWAIPDNPSNRPEVEFDYFDKLLTELVSKHGIDPDKIMVSGFSGGGMTVWNLACRMSERFIGFVPISGTFWAPVPDTCPAPPANVSHIHGTSDPVVPIEGRPIADTHQGSVTKTLSMYAELGGYNTPPEVYEDAGLECSSRENPDGKILEYCSHPGGHSLKTLYVTRSWDRFLKQTEN